MLWFALELPSLPLQIAERAGASRTPLVIGEGTAQRPLVACANEAARQAGIREGQAVAAAKALAGELRVLERDTNGERDTLERLAAWAGQFTPMVCVDDQGISLEVEASLKLFQGHAKLAAAIRRGILELGFHATLGVAPTPLAARLFARAAAQGRAVRGCLALDELRERVADLPLFLLDWPGKTLSHLADLGVLRLRDMLELPPEGIARRFGPEIVASLDRLVGRLPDPRLPHAPPSRFRSRIELPEEAEGVEALLFPLKRLLAELEGYLRGRGAGVQRLTLILEHGRLEHGNKVRTRLELDFASPEREADFILAIAREKLGRLTLPAASIALDLRAEALQPYAPRSSAWLPGPKEQAIDCERLLERLAARLGSGKVFGIALADDHRPERDWVPAYAGTTVTVHRHPGIDRGPISCFRPIWLLPRPQRLITQQGQPSFQGPLALGAGPERIEAGWWDGEEVRRDYYVATNPRGERFWIYREHRNLNAWYLHGIFA
ncbi:MAG: Y-family DNA polymerase [Usitatibacter sp.]